MTTRTDHGMFVAAARWALADGWATTDKRSGKSRILHEPTRTGFDYYDYDTEARIVVDRLDEDLLPMEDLLAADVASVQQAIDHLVTAKVLPVELASWASVDGITATMRALHMTAIDLRPAFEGVGEAS